jgi:hypothetical protein
MALGGASLRSFSMPLTAEQRQERARRAADARHHPGEDPGELERTRIDRKIDDLVAIGASGRMSPEQAARIGRLFRYAPPRDPGTDTG